MQSNSNQYQPPLLLPNLEVQHSSSNQRVESKQNIEEKKSNEVQMFEEEMSQIRAIKIHANERLAQLYPKLVGQNNIYSFTYKHNESNWSN